MSIKSSAFAYLLRPRVLHALPGRLRIHLPLLKRLPIENGGAVQFVARVLSVPTGITEVAPCLVTGNVLVNYDAERLTADDVLRYLRSATQLCLSNRDRLEGLTAGRLQEVEERLCKWLSGQLSYRLELDGNARIPEDVLA